MLCATIKNVPLIDLLNDHARVLQVRLKRHILNGNYVTIGLFCIGMVCFLLALPLDSLSGAGRGFLSRPYPFSGCYIIFFGLLLPFSGIYGIPWIVVTLANVFILVSPISFIAEVLTPYKRHRLFFGVWSAISFFAAPLLFMLWPDGYFIGAWVWALGIVITCLATAVSLTKTSGKRNRVQCGFEVVQREDEKLS